MKANPQSTKKIHFNACVETVENIVFMYDVNGSFASFISLNYILLVKDNTLNIPCTVMSY